MNDLIVKKLGFRFDEREDGRQDVLFEDFDLTIGSGEIVVVTGPSGCGKSSLLNLMAGFHRPQHGQVQFDDKPVAEARVPTAYIFQDSTLFPWLTVSENVAWLGRLPDTIEALRPRDTPIWLPFWLVFGPVAAYYTYLPLDNYKLFRALGLFVSLGLFALSHHWRRKRWWQGQPLAYLLLAPFALPNMLLVFVLHLLIESLRWMLGSVQDRVLLHIGMILAAVGFLIDMVQTFLLFV
jgi:hypothetical protein